MHINNVMDSRVVDCKFQLSSMLMTPTVGLYSGGQSCRYEMKVHESCGVV